MTRTPMIYKRIHMDTVTHFQWIVTSSWETYFEGREREVESIWVSIANIYANV